jgi:signal transduction histidine kinase
VVSVTELEAPNKKLEDSQNYSKYSMRDLTRLPLAGESKINPDDLLEVLRMLAHKLSQPLTSLRGSVEVALMGELDELECRRVLDLCLQESHRMAETLEALRDILEIEGSIEESQRVCWTQSVEQLLEKAASVDGNYSLQLVSNVKDEIWVKASPEHLDRATTRLISAAVKAAHSKRVVRIGLSAFEETARLSVCEEGMSPGVEPHAGAGQADFTPSLLELGQLDEWIVRRATERQGGWLEIGGASNACRCYHLNLPLAASKVAEKARIP